MGPEGKVHAFEPDPANFALLKQNVGLNGCTNVTLHPFALSDRNETVQLYLSEDNAGDHRTWPAQECRQSVSVPTKVLDEVLGPSFRVNLVKMDIQGAEGAALRGMTRLLARQARLSLFTEYWPFGLREGRSERQRVSRQPSRIAV